MPKLKWLPEALEDIGQLYDFLAEKSPQAAVSAALCIRSAAIKLEEFPEFGAPMNDDSERRQLYVAFGAGDYVLQYRLDHEGDPVIIRVWHSREERR